MTQRPTLCEQATANLPGLHWCVKDDSHHITTAYEDDTTQARMFGDLYLELRRTRAVKWTDADYTLTITQGYLPHTRPVFCLGPHSCIPDAIRALDEACDKARPILKVIMDAALPWPFPSGPDGLAEWLPLAFPTLTPHQFSPDQPFPLYAPKGTDRFCQWLEPVSEYALLFALEADLSLCHLQVYRVQHESPSVWTPADPPAMSQTINKDTSISVMFDALKQDALSALTSLESLGFLLNPRRRFT